MKYSVRFVTKALRILLGRSVNMDAKASAEEW